MINYSLEELNGFFRVWFFVGTFHFIGIYSQLAASVNLVLGGHDEHVSQCGLRALRLACAAEQLIEFAA